MLGEAGDTVDGEHLLGPSMLPRGTEGCHRESILFALPLCITLPNQPRSWAYLQEVGLAGKKQFSTKGE